MSTPARAALLLLLTLGFVRLTAAHSDELTLLRAKAERGNALAEYNLGLAYTQGRLTSPDPAEAFLWLTLASESGATGRALDSLLGKITDEQLAEGRRRLALYRNALAARTTPAGRGTPRLAPRGFSLEPMPAPADPSPPAPLTRAPEPVATPITTSPGEGLGASDSGDTRNELEKSRAELLAANAELITLRLNVAQLEVAAMEAKNTEARLTAELTAARQQIAASKLLDPQLAAEKLKSEDSAPHHP